ncbi:SurA N-terminal domain-containing protein [Variovorax terrae]|uniref:Periplasmic chaperone PpiD n=1 Tax=Variovorax terrae TaxID=2923278 RepID=A0A9X1VTZ7_9BURK|nr:SurA N-terminal domain-containing protein [Variovorax terrae]MCJ0763811.1 SurA N-terminal domain-containing protein [Variovorax terrae]
MFDFVRKHTKIMQFLLFLLIFPSFVLFGVDGYNRFREKGEAVAKVDGHDINQSEWDAAHKEEVERLRSSMPSIDPKLLDSPEARYATLERLVRDRVLLAAADKFKLATSDQRLARELQENPTIASLRRPDGTLDMDRYRQLAGSQGMTPEMFEARVRGDLSTRQVLMGVAGTGFATAAQADVALNAYFEKRDVQLARFNTSDFAAKISPSDAELEAFYKNNQALFQAPEQANIEYVVLDLDTVKKGLTVNEQDLKTYYEQNATRLSGQEERRASHILINAPKSASAADRQKARQKADALLAAVRKAPDSFADVAKKNSQDPGSAPNGGDLDFFARGAMVKPFEDAVFAMKKGDISDVVESDFGYHIIKLTDIRAPKQRSFEEMRPEIEAELMKQQAQRKFAEMADAFTNGVYEQSDSLKPVADRLKLDIKTASNVMRKPAPGATGVLANPKFLNAIFSPDSVEKKRNTEAVETGASQLVAGRITQYTPAHVLPLAEVKANVRERVLAARGAEQAKKEGLAKLEAWKANPAAAVLPETAEVSRDQTQKLPAPVVEAALRADASALPVLVGVDLGAQGYAVLKVNKVVARDEAKEASAKQDRAQYAQWVTSAEGMAYYNLLKERFKAQIKVAKPAARKSEELAQAE